MINNVKKNEFNISMYTTYLDKILIITCLKCYKINNISWFHGQWNILLPEGANLREEKGYQRVVSEKWV